MSMTYNTFDFGQNFNDVTLHRFYSLSFLFLHYLPSSFHFFLLTIHLKLIISYHSAYVYQRLDLNYSKYIESKIEQKKNQHCTINLKHKEDTLAD